MKTAAKNPKGLRLEAMALEIPEFPGHPNRVPFAGVLTRIDEPSDRAPNGAAGHRVLLPRDVAERALPSLLGMAVDYAPGLRGHDVRRKVGVVTRAEIVENRLEVAGHLFGKDFPDVVADLRAGRERLGMSYEVSQVRVQDATASVWVLSHIVFTGAAILERSAAAYQSTSLAAASAGQNRGEPMDERIVKALDQLAESNRALTAEFSNLRSIVDEMRGGRVLEGATGEFDRIEERLDKLTRTSEDLCRENEALRAQAERYSAQVNRKTVPPQVQTLLAKSGVTTDIVGPGGTIEVSVLDKALEGLGVEQRMAVKSQLARAGVLG